MGNFEKPLTEFTKEELIKRLDNWDPRYGTLASFELIRREVAESSKSSKRFAIWSLVLAVVAIALSFSASLVQIYLVWPK